jgi:hypothetical protein
MNAQIIRKSTTILELPAGWLAKERGTTYKTAHAALQATRREDRAITRDLPSSAVVRIINWEPTTNAGRAVVLALNPQSESFGLTTLRNQ